MNITHPDANLVKKAGKALKPHVLKTPLLHASTLDRLVSETLGVSNVKVVSPFLFRPTIL
eukprot:Awhi_evm2s3324